MISSDIQILSIDELNQQFLNVVKLNVSLVRQGCKIIEVPFVGGGTVFFPTLASSLEELTKLVDDISKQLYNGGKYIVVYEKMDKPLTTLSYYKVIAIRSSDMLDLKKAFKILKLKAFL